MAAMLSITALEGEHQGDVLEAAYNANRFVLDRTLVWQRQPGKPAGDLEFERVEPKRLSVELLFEAMVGLVQPDLDKLHRFCGVDAVLHRPPKVEVSWGRAAHAIPSFDGVIESISIRYAGVADGGVPLHAIVEL